MKSTNFKSDIPFLETDHGSFLFNPFEVDWMGQKQLCFDLTLLSLGNEIFADWKGRQEFEEFLERQKSKKSLPERVTIPAMVGYAYPKRDACISGDPWMTPCLMLVQNKPKSNIHEKEWWNVRRLENGLYDIINISSEIPYSYSYSRHMPLIERTHRRNYRDIAKWFERPEKILLKKEYGPKFELFKF